MWLHWCHMACWNENIWMNISQLHSKCTVWCSWQLSVSSLPQTAHYTINWWQHSTPVWLLGQWVSLQKLYFHIIITKQSQYKCIYKLVQQTYVLSNDNKVQDILHMYIQASNSSTQYLCKCQFNGLFCNLMHEGHILLLVLVF